MYTLRFLSVTAAILIASLNSTQLDAQLSIEWQTIDAGGGFSTGSSFELNTTLGQFDAGEKLFGANFELVGGFWNTSSATEILLGDVNQDGVVNLLDVGPFVDAISSGIYIPEADVNQDSMVNLLDVQPFIDILSG